MIKISSHDFDHFLAKYRTFSIFEILTCLEQVLISSPRIVVFVSSGSLMLSNLM